MVLRWLQGISAIYCELGFLMDHPLRPTRGLNDGKFEQYISQNILNISDL